MIVLKAKVILATCVIISGLGLNYVSASWQPLHNGDLVFDAKRFNDNVKNYVQQAQAAINTAKSFANRELAFLKMPAPAQKVLDDINNAPVKINEKINGATIIDSKISLKDKSELYHKIWDVHEAVQDAGEFRKKILNESEKANQDALNYMDKILNRNQLRGVINVETSRDETKGNLGEVQKASSQKALAGMDEIDKIHLEELKILHKIQEIQAKTSKIGLFELQQRNLWVKPYDPFHKDKYDKEQNKSTSENFGFIRYK